MNQVRIEGTIENIIFHNEENGYTVMDFDSDNELIPVVGDFGEVAEGESLIITGNYVIHPKFGEQLKMECYEQKLPDTAINIEKYLASGAIKGISKNLAKRIVSAFGDDSLEIIEKEPLRLMEIRGISKTKCDEIIKDSKRVLSLRMLKTFFDKYNIKYAFAMKTFRCLGADALDQIKLNPYVLCENDIGIDFATADEIAFSHNIEKNSYNRIISGMKSVLKNETLQGHSCLPDALLFHSAVHMLGVTEEDLTSAYEKAVGNKELFEYTAGEVKYVYLPEYYRAEKYIANWVRAIRPARKKKNDCELLIDDEEKKNNIKYNELQRKAISDAVTEKAMVLTGGPGTGKTTTLNAIISIMKKTGMNVVLTAPTGRASKRMTELTGYEAKTIHRLLGVIVSDSANKKSYIYNEENPVDCDVVIMDEVSMVDVLLFETLIRALKPKCQLIITGDSDQLPSIGAGNLLRDLTDSQALPVIRLKEIFRQARQSLIITNAHRIVSGEYPDLSQKENDFFFFRRSNCELALQLVVDLVKERLPRTYGYSPFDDIQVIAPSRKGTVGTNMINKVLQDVLNPNRNPLKNSSPDETSLSGNVLRKGDKVMQNVNNYGIEWEKDDGETGTGIFNGDIGRVVSVSKGNVRIDFDGKKADYTPEQLIQIELAYAITVHKSQGCEFEVVIIPVQDGYDMLNHRNLLYTAVTRAKKLLILIGNENVIRRMVDSTHGMERYTCLKNMLSENGKENNNVKQ